ncbi:MAG: glycosyltransferase family 4 protein [Crocinitomicaceae bacterium]|jgi:glycosyltransferase involved in cell wall biosynthesis
MKIVFINKWFSEKMGYVENYLPSAFGKFGCEVHLVTSDLQVYADQTELYDSVYSDFLGEKVVESGVFPKEHYVLHRNKHSNLGGLHISELNEKLRELKPDIVYLTEILTIDFLNVIKLKSEIGYEIFTESRLHTSILHWPKNWKELMYYVRMFNLGRKTSKYISKYYPIAKDVAFNINLIYGIPKSKIKLSALGVDTNKFSSIRFSSQEKQKFRQSINLNDNDFLCIYTGRLNEDKNPLLLAKAVNYLFNLGYKNIKALFVGKGTDIYKLKLLENSNCLVKDFVVNSDLPLIYSSSNIGVWPNQESTSRLDAMSCGLPIIINDTISNKKLIKDCGFSFKTNNYIDLANKILILYNNKNIYNLKSINSRENIKLNYSWSRIAELKIIDFNYFINKH